MRDELINYATNPELSEYYKIAEGKAVSLSVFLKRLKHNSIIFERMGRLQGDYVISEVFEIDKEKKQVTYYFLGALKGRHEVVWIQGYPVEDRYQVGVRLKDENKVKYKIFGEAPEPFADATIKDILGVQITNLRDWTFAKESDARFFRSVIAISGLIEMYKSRPKPDEIEI